MTNDKYAKAYTEVLEILKYLPKNEYNEQYQSEQIFMILFYYRYANVINKMNTPAEIGGNVKTSSFLIPAYYNPDMS